MKIRTLDLALPLIAALLLAAAPPGASQALEKPFFMTEEPHYNNYADIHGFRIDDNATHLFFTMVTGSPYPPGFPSSTISTPEYMVGAVTLIYSIAVDLDNNVLTGIAVSAHVYGSTAILGIDLYVSYNYLLNRVDIYFYAPNGTHMGTYYMPVTGMDDYPEVVIGIDWLETMYQQYTGVPLSIDTMRVVPAVAYNQLSLEDRLSPDTFTNVTINSSAITVDGDPFDWDPTATLLAIDGYDGFSFTTLGDNNMTALYVATDNSSLFFRIDFEHVVTDYLLLDSYFGPSCTRFISINLDTNNDGTTDYGVKMYPDRVEINTASYQAGTSAYNVSWHGTSTAEFAVGLPQLGLTGFTAGDRLSMQFRSSYLFTSDDYMLFQYPVPSPYPDIVYTLGQGGYTGGYGGVYPLSAGPNLVVYGNTSITVTSTGTYLYTGEFPYDPTGLGGPGLPAPPITDYSYFTVQDPSTLTWPITVTIDYSEARLSAMGVSESEITPFYYDKASGRYQPITAFAIDPGINSVTIVVDRSLYEAGDPILVLSSSPSTVGGQLVEPSTGTAIKAASVAVLAAGAAFAALAWTRRRS